MQSSPVEDANCLSRYFFWWTNPIMRKGFKEKLRPSDICQAPSQDTADVLSERLEKEWDREVGSGKKKPSLLRALARCFIQPFLLFGVLLYIGEATKSVQPQVLGRIIASFDPAHEPERAMGYFLAMGLGLLFTARFLLLQPAMFGLHRLGMQIRIALFSIIYKKTLKLSSRVLDKISTGQLVSLMSANLGKFDQSLGMAHFIWISPLQCILCTGLIWEHIDVNSFSALAAISLLGVLQAFLSHKMGPYKTQKAILTNKRLALTSEIMENLHSVKAYGWEEIMETLIKNIRQDEVKLTRKIGSLRYFYSSAYFFSAIFVIVAAVVPHALSRGINLRRIFTTLSYCMVLRMTITRQLPSSIQMWYDTMQLIWKIEEFLSKEEYMLMEYDLSITELELKNVTASWDEGTGELLERIKQENKADGHPNGDAFLFFTHLYVTPVLKDISLNLKKGEMLAVAGSMGSGKSSLLLTILGELVPSSGKIRHSGRISYSSQTAWIMPGTIRDNILFGLTYDEYRYKSVVKACQLEEDLAALPEKDKTPMAEGGLNLSGGQKACVALARAVYRDADVYLLDAPFSHLDIATEKEIFDKCLCKLIAFKTRILVTNKIDHLKQADKILLLHNGESFFYGTFSKLQSERPDFSSLLLGLESYDSFSAKHRCSILTETLRRVSVDESGGIRPEHPSYSQVPPSKPKYIDEQKPSVILNPLGAARKASFIQVPEEEVQRTLPDRKFSLVPENELVDESFMGSDIYHNHGVHMAGQRRQSVLAFMTNSKSQVNSTRRDHLQSSFHRRLSVVPQSDTRRLSDSTYDITGILEEETIEACLVDEIEEAFETTKWNTYVRYVSNNKSLLYVLILILIIAAIEVIAIFVVYFLGASPVRPKYNKLFNISSPGKNDAIIVTPTSSYYILYIYVATSESLLAIGFFRGLPLVHTMITISKKLHQKMLRAVLRAPMSVLNPMKTGRIMNRFTKDMATIDDMLPLLMFDFVQLTVVVVGCILVVSIVRPYIFLAATPLAIIFIGMRKYFLHTGQQLKQMETEARSPIFSHLMISLKGLWTIRAFERQAYFENLFQKAMNTHTATWFLYLSTLRWFLFRADIIFVFFFTLAAWIAVGTNQDKPGETGIIICLAMLILGNFQWCVATSIAVEGMMRSVDRVFKFIDLPSETPKLDRSKGSDLIIENVDALPDTSWPNRGMIDVRNVTVKYTGAGHAVLKNLSFSVEGGQRVGILGRTGSGKSTLFNAFMKLVYTDGNISIDGVNWNKMPLQKWRKAFGVVPQKVFIFTGTFRMNLDPYGCHSDEELWQVVEEVGLKSMIEQFPDKLDFQLEYGGYVLTYGHKQLICLARSILSRARILLLDEPSAHLDPITIKVLKKTLRQSFSKCTILLSEHKVEPLLECQSFLMMEKGQVKTYESIQGLLNETSHLKQAISPAEQLKLFPRRNSSMHIPQSKLCSVTQTLQEEAEDYIQDTRL
ncbi:LOW QUALITY PROTEIN: cystic fibrosis transmembrane conductance regulator-like [Xyrauchen texanus]|uniref:LOW QUALITY PROTEIN: cystic fibrosis transmembrane conductance regulator-like n=1 Tax=Xyrauchen texanus TaxID=154827 RepID=UPI002241CCB2|nr:LOW QUALITY PROTEIN: cystic fibrosis transmembrane conductance regulator-like [Xyrauchen texanus]